MTEDVVFLYRESINTLGQHVSRSDLPAGAERVSIRHIMPVDPADESGDVRSVDVYLVK